MTWTKHDPDNPGNPTRLQCWPVYTMLAFYYLEFQTRLGIISNMIRSTKVSRGVVHDIKSQ